MFLVTNVKPHVWINKDKKFVISAHNTAPKVSRGHNVYLACPASTEIESIGRFTYWTRGGSDAQKDVCGDLVLAEMRSRCKGHLNCAVLVENSICYGSGVDELSHIGPLNYTCGQGNKQVQLIHTYGHNYSCSTIF